MVDYGNQDGASEELQYYGYKPAEVAVSKSVGVAGLECSSSKAMITKASASCNYGYGEAVPGTDKYGYGEAAPDVSQYGYGEAAPDTAKYGHEKALPDKWGDGEAVPDADKYGYGVEAPDTARYGYGNAASDTEKYGYGEATPDADKYGYGDATPDTAQYGYGDDASDTGKYGYGEAAPEPLPHRQSRRSSLKHEGAPRRSSISYTGEVENILPGSGGRPVRRRTSISFDGNNSVKEIQPAKELAENPEELWFQKDEYNLIREKAQLLTDLASAALEDERILAGKKNKFCFRGLESHINAAYVENEQHLAWKSVFLEQYHQRQKGGFDDETVAVLYEMAAMPSRARALERARGDFEEAEKHTRGIRASRRHSTLT